MRKISLSEKLHRTTFEVVVDRIDGELPLKVCVHGISSEFPCNNKTQVKKKKLGFFKSLPAAFTSSH